MVAGELVRPLNAAGVVGYDVTLHCRHRSPHVTWSFVPLNAAQPIIITSDCVVAPNVKDLYKVDTPY